jgi:hypothetical protein
MTLEELRVVLYKAVVFAVVGEKATTNSINVLRNAAPLQGNRGGVGALPLKAWNMGIVRRLAKEMSLRSFD